MKLWAKSNCSASLEPVTKHFPEANTAVVILTHSFSFLPFPEHGVSQLQIPVWNGLFLL